MFIFYFYVEMKFFFYLFLVRGFVLGVRISRLWNFIIWVFICFFSGLCGLLVKDKGFEILDR